MGRSDEECTFKLSYGTDGIGPTREGNIILVYVLIGIVHRDTESGGGSQVGWSGECDFEGQHFFMGHPGRASTKWVSRGRGV